MELVRYSNIKKKPMNYTVTRLDRRYAHWEEFNYMIEFHCNPDWVWSCRSQEYRIYVNDPAFYL